MIKWLCDTKNPPQKQILWNIMWSLCLWNSSSKAKVMKFCQMSRLLCCSGCHSLSLTFSFHLISLPLSRMIYLSRKTRKYDYIVMKLCWIFSHSLHKWERKILCADRKCTHRCLCDCLHKIASLLPEMLDLIGSFGQWHKHDIPATDLLDLSGRHSD